MADRTISELDAAELANLHDSALIHVVDLTEPLAADQNLKTTLALLRNALVYAGAVNADGTAGTPFPSGWSSQLNSNVFTITHNLGNTSYVVLLTVEHTGPSSDATATLSSRGANGFTARTWVEGTGASDKAFNFLLVLGEEPEIGAM